MTLIPRCAHSLARARVRLAMPALDAADYVHGAIVSVDGGWLAR